MKLEAHELQALLRHHCASIVEAIDDGGIEPSKITELLATADRIKEVVVEIKKCPLAL